MHKYGVSLISEIYIPGKHHLNSFHCYLSFCIMEININYADERVCVL